MKVEIKKLDHQGRGIAYMEDHTIFVLDALVGEEVEIEILKKKKKIMEAKSIQIWNPSPDRVPSLCPYFKECGGCDLLHMCYEKQIQYKENKIKEIMKKYVGNSFLIAPLLSSKEFQYRNKAVFQVNQKIGFFKKKSSEIVEIEKCLLLSEKMNEVLKKLKKVCDNKNLKQIMIREGSKDMLVVLEGIETFLVPKSLSYVSIITRKNDLHLINGKSYVLEKIGEYEFKISADSFFQVNKTGMEILYNVVLKYSGLTGKEKVLDLYCGTGTIGIFLSKNAKKVIGIEINPRAVLDANWNKEHNHITNIEFLCGDSGLVLRNLDYHPDLVIVDPPRAGLNECMIQELKNINALKIIYVSCDPMTLARDIKRLEELYQVHILVPVDMFPNTYHVECVCVMNRL